MATGTASWSPRRAARERRRTTVRRRTVEDGAELRATVAHLLEIPHQVESKVSRGHAALVDRFASVRGFVAVLCETIEFGATAQARACSRR